MADKPILFSAPMIRALLEGRKTQTRRVLKPQPQEDIGLWLAERSLPYAVGDRLWAREGHYLTDNGDEATVVYAEDDDAVARHRHIIGDTKHRLPLSDKWAHYHLKKRPSIHMPRWASRITLIVTDVRVERLQDITEEDAIAEGWPGPTTETGYPISTPLQWFSALWSSINGFGAWEANPWVAAYTFRVIPKNIDQVSAND